jgi:hypothetical protein
MRLLYELSPLPAGLAAYLALLAQVTSIEPGMAGLFGNVVTAGVLAWYVIYDVRVRTPAMLAAFAAQLEENRRTFREEQASTRQSFLLVVESLRTSFHAEQMAIRNHCDKESTELRNMLIDNLKAYRTAVHDVRDTAQTLISQKAVE